MKKKILILLIVILAIFSTKAYASEESLGADVYYFDSIESLDFYKLDKDFDELNSAEQRKLTTSLLAYTYSHRLKKDRRLSFNLGEENSFVFENQGFYLIDFDKKIEGSNIHSSKDVLIKAEGDASIFVKDEDQDLKPGDDEDLYLDVVFDAGDIEFSDSVKVGLYASEGNLLETVILNEKNKYRHTFKNLDPKKKYAVWPLNLDDYYFSIDRIANVFYIRLTGKKKNPNNSENQGTIEKPGDVDNPSNPDENHENVNKNDGSSGKNSKTPSTHPNQNQANNQGNFGINNSKTKEKKLPQTGLLWLPVPFLIAIGIILIAYGRKK